MHLIDSPPCRSLVVAGYVDAPTAADHVPDVLEHEPLGLEGVDDKLIEDMTLLGHTPPRPLAAPAGQRLPRDRGRRRDQGRRPTRRGAAIIASLEQAGGGLRGTKLYDDPQAEEHIWAVREAGLGATAFIPGKPDTHEGWEDSAVPPERLGEYLRELRRSPIATATRAPSTATTARAACTPAGTSTSRAPPASPHWRRFMDDAAELVLSLGGSLSGEHGDGQARAELLPKMFGPELVEAFREFKSIWDPDWRMNPGKVVDPYPIASNLRFGSGYRPAEPKTHFAYPRDGGSFAHATVRCVGVGKCRRTGRRRDVPELHGDARGEALDPRTRPSPLGDGRTARSSTSGAPRRFSTRSTSACPARAARATVRSGSTCRP